MTKDARRLAYAARTQHVTQSTVAVPGPIRAERNVPSGTEAAPPMPIAMMVQALAYSPGLFRK